MATDDVGDHRVKAARERANAWLDKEVREGELQAAASQPELTPPTPMDKPIRTMPINAQPGGEAPMPRESREEQELRNANDLNQQLNEDNFYEICQRR